MPKMPIILAKAKPGSGKKREKSNFPAGYEMIPITKSMKYHLIEIPTHSIFLLYDMFRALHLNAQFVIVEPLWSRIFPLNIGKKNFLRFGSKIDIFGEK